MQQGRCSSAIVGGIALSLRAESMAAMLAQGIFSKKGTVAPLDANADGTVIGEGCAAIVLNTESEPSRCQILGCGYSRSPANSPFGVPDHDMMWPTRLLEALVGPISEGIDWIRFSFLLSSHCYP